MVSTKALAAIALTLIIAMPIGIGFLTAVHQEETDNWQTTSSSKISDLMLNHQTPYYGSYKGSSNNASLWRNGAIVTPDYVTVSSSFTSLPIYTTTTTTVNLPQTSYLNHDMFGADAVAPSQREWISNTNIIGVHDFYRIRSGTVALSESGFSSLSDMYSGYTFDTTNDIYLIRNSANTWAAYDGSTLISNNIVYWWNNTQTIGNPPTSNVIYKEFTQITTSTPYSGVVNKGVMQVGSTYYTGTSTFQVAANSVTIAGEETEYETLPSIYIAQAGNIGLSVVSATGSYANPSDGWTVPSVSGTYEWLNNQVNQTVTFYVKTNLGAEQYATIGNLRIYSATPQQVGAYLVSEGSDSAKLLGAYTYLQVIMSTEGYTITGLPSWPTMGTVPTTYNSITIEDPIDTFDTVTIQATSTNWHFRVDNANIKQGTYPSTYDYTLNLQQIYPDTNIDIYLNSIGIYGDYINFGGALMTVENGSVTINGQTYRLLHAHLSAWADDGGHYSLRINGDEVATTSEPPTIFWGGEWSVTATAYKIEKVHEYVTVWHAGEFGLDKKGFAVAGLLACAAMFVALGMTGQRSGGKAGVLLLICGGAAIVFLLII